MALLSVIRRWALRDKISIRAISRRTGLSRNTIRTYLRAETVEPKFKVPDRPSKLDPFADKLSHWLRVEVGKSRKRTTVRGVFVPLAFQPGDAFQFDWSEDWAILAGEHQVAGGPLQAVAQPHLHSARLPAADARDVV